MGGISESAVIMVVLATGFGEAESFRIKRRAFRLVPPDGRFLVRRNAIAFRAIGIGHLRFVRLIV